MKKSIKGIGLSLCAMLLLAGCSCKKEEPDTKANISNPTETIVSGLKNGVESITLQQIYDDLKSSKGNEVASNKLLEIIAEAVLSDAKWKERYDAKVEEKLQELIDSADYQIDGVFDEEKLVKSLKSKLYNVTCTDNEYGPTYTTNNEIDKYMLCDYTDYINKALKLSILTELLNEKYIVDKVMVDKSNILSTKRSRLVEYVEINYSNDEEEDEVIKYIEESVAQLAAENSTVTLSEIASTWTNKKIDDVVAEYNKIGTSGDLSGSIMQDFTDGYTRTKEEGLKIKKQSVYATNYYNKLVINSDNSDILNATLVEKILSENLLAESSRKTIKINNSYYLVAPWAGRNITSNDIRIKDSTNKKYYIVKVDVITKDSNEDLVYEDIRVLAKNTSLVSDSISYYLEQNKNDISAHDEEIYTYLKTQYADIFVD